MVYWERVYVNIENLDEILATATNRNIPNKKPCCTEK